MAYNYYPNNYYNVGGYQPQNYQPQINTGMMWVNGENEARNYPVAPNNAVSLWDASGQYVYIKQTDASGKPSFKTFKLTEHTQVQAEPQRTVDYITREEFNQSIQKLQDKINLIKGGNDDDE